MPEDSDQLLVDRTLDGNKKAFDLLVLRYQHRVAALVGRFVQDPQEAEDVSQETFIKAYRALPRFRGDSSFYTWLYRIAVNTAKNHLVAKSRRPPAEDVDLEEAEAAGAAGMAAAAPDGPERHLSAEHLRRAIVRAIAELPEELRTALTLREFAGLSYEDITQVMDCPVGTVRSRIFRAREAVDRKIRKMLPE